ncbi:MAG: CcoQ/FixQ family Cbb3-type cytochrome c oxidase assembly chaperone [Planctomycetota bacterium]|jgi:cbb3-type cytochrome oxidase subunit 3
MGFLDLSLVKQVTLLFFFLFFCGVLAWVFFSRRAKQFTQESRLPLEEGHRVATPMTASGEEASHVR